MFRSALARATASAAAPAAVSRALSLRALSSLSPTPLRAAAGFRALPASVCRASPLSSEALVLHALRSSSSSSPSFFSSQSYTSSSIAAPSSSSSTPSFALRDTLNLALLGAFSFPTVHAAEAPAAGVAKPFATTAPPPADLALPTDPSAVVVGAVADAATAPATAAVAAAAPSSTSTSTSWFSSWFGGDAASGQWEPPGAFTSAFVNAMDYLQAATGLPWWASISIFAFGIRLLASPLNVIQLRDSSKMSVISPQLAQLRAELQGAPDPAARQAVSQKMTGLLQSSGVNPVRSVLLGLVSVPLFIGMFLAVRNIASNPEYAAVLAQESLGIFANMRHKDESYLLPAISAASSLFMLEVTFKDSPTTSMMKIMRWGLRGLTLISVPVIASFPKLLFAFWIPSNIFSLAWTFLARSNRFRAMIGAAPRIDPLLVQAAARGTIPVSAVQAASSAAAAAAVKTKAAPIQMFKGPMPKTLKQGAAGTSAASNKKA